MERLGRVLSKIRRKDAGTNPALGDQEPRLVLPDRVAADIAERELASLALRQQKARDYRLAERIEKELADKLREKLGARY